MSTGAASSTTARTTSTTARHPSTAAARHCSRRPVDGLQPGGDGIGHGRQPQDRRHTAPHGRAAHRSRAPHPDIPSSTASIRPTWPRTSTTAATPPPRSRTWPQHMGFRVTHAADVRRLVHVRQRGRHVSVDYERDWYNGMRVKNIPSGFNMQKQDYRSEFTNNFKGSNTLRVGAEVKPLRGAARRIRLRPARCCVTPRVVLQHAAHLPDHLLLGRRGIRHRRLHHRPGVPVPRQQEHVVLPLLRARCRKRHDGYGQPAFTRPTTRASTPY